MYRIIIISGSARLGRQTPKAVKTLEAMLDKQELVSDVVVLDVKDYDFPVMEERRGRNSNPPPRLDEFGEHIESASTDEHLRF